MRQPNFWLSNFKKAPITTNVGEKTITFPSSEHYFQAMKFYPDMDKIKLIAAAKKPKDAAYLGRTLEGMDPNWNSKKDDIMLQALLLKFGQNLDLNEKLLATGDAELVEAATTDAYWGWGKDHHGKNMLGKLLMQVRDVLKS
jgi:ribA/ribD-fused uncharacterized protein